MSKTSRYFWLKLPKDFFKRHDMRIIEDMEDGKEMLLFYMKLLCESLDHEGSLRYSDKLPYTDTMLATITNTNVKVVKKALNLFSSLGLLEVYEDDTIFMSKVPEMTGSETHTAQYMRQYRKQRKEEYALGEFANVFITKEELNKLKDFYPKNWAAYIEKLSAHKKSGGVFYEDDYATIKKWLLKDIGEME